MARLKTLESRLKAAPASRIKTLNAGVYATAERKRGSAGVKDRERIKARDCGMCKNCQRLGRDVDHDIPLWAGGSDDESNKQLLCGVCHSAKTELEARQRAAGAYDRGAVLRRMAEVRAR